MSDHLQKLMWTVAVAVPLLLAGCAPGSVASGAKASAATTTTMPSASVQENADIKDARATLSADDRLLVEAQEFCPVMTTSRLGAMGAPIKVMVKDQPVFVCCKGCIRKAQKEADKTLATVADQKAKTKAANK